MPKAMFHSGSLAKILGRPTSLFQSDLEDNRAAIAEALRGARILVYGGAGSIGREVVRLLFQARPKALHVIDISENRLADLVRSLRSSDADTSVDARFLPLDMTGPEAAAFLASEPAHDIIINFAALKHVRSEKDAFSLMRMVKVNVLDTALTLAAARAAGARKYFAVSTDKAMRPANLMGATKRIMEDVLFSGASLPPVSTARFANVAFSDGSLLHAFTQRLAERQPLAGPVDTRRYFITGQEAARLCLLSIVCCHHGEIICPNPDVGLKLTGFQELAVRYLAEQGFEAVFVNDEQEARASVEDHAEHGRWPCFFTVSDTAGEKPEEEFFGPDDTVDRDRFAEACVIHAPSPDEMAGRRVETFVSAITALRDSGSWDAIVLRSLIAAACPTLEHLQADRSLDSKM
ncbi:polysaccharide biosynthesis protein [Thermaurantiacus sp.]